mmetsp:Transcript_119151/g.332455  ORF Transcript_119151/g.332455 Transcript_119151/m.332455 type:complete len:289 (-) Transcript_119151:819-1685(-)
MGASVALRVRRPCRGGRLAIPQLLQIVSLDVGLPILLPALELLVVGLQLPGEPGGAEDHVVQPLLRALQRVLQRVGLQGLLVEHVISLLGGAKGSQRLRLRNARHSLHEEAWEDILLGPEHGGVVVILVAQQGGPDVLQAHAFAPLALPVAPDHVPDLHKHRSLVLGEVLHLPVGFHEDRKQHVQEQQHHDQHESKEPQECLDEPNLLHLVPVPVAEHSPEGGVQRAVKRSELQGVLTKEEHCIHRHAEVHRQEDQSKVQQVVPGLLERVGHDGQARLCIEGLEEPQH